MKTSLLPSIILILLSGQVIASGERTCPALHPTGLPVFPPSYNPPSGVFVVAEAMTQIWTAGNWANLQLVTYSYVQDTLVSEKLTQEWIEGNWVNSGLTTYNYNQYGQPEMAMYYNWNISLDLWQENLRGIYYYNPITHLLDEVVYQQNDGVIWRNEMRYVYVYTLTGKMSTALLQHWNNEVNDWVNRSLTTYTYDSGDILQEMLVQDWAVSEWQNLQKVLYSYNGMGWLVTRLVKDWMDLLWVDDMRYTLMYNPDGEMTSELLEFWDGADWYNHQEWNYGYDVNGNLVMKLQMDWSESGGWVNSLLTTYEYYVVGLTEQQPEGAEGTLRVAPNPACDVIYITVPGGDGILLVTDMLGNTVFQKHVQPDSMVISLGGLAPGMYVARYQDGMQVQTVKINVSR